MKLIGKTIAKFSSNDINKIEKDNHYKINEEITIKLSDVEISSADIPGFSVATNNGITVALDINLSNELKEEGLAREFVNRIQGLRKDNGLKVTDTIEIWIEKNETIKGVIKNNLAYICEETLASQIKYEAVLVKNTTKLKLINGISLNVLLVKN